MLRDSLGQGDAPGLADEVLVVHHGRVPGQLQEVQQLPHLLLGPEHQLLVADGQTAALRGPLTLAVHGLHRRTPLGQAVSVAAQVKARDGDLWQGHTVYEPGRFMGSTLLI